MPNVHSLPPDKRASALYLIAHQGTLKAPRPVEVQHMRIRRYMDLLGERQGMHHHYDEAHDIYIDFNFTGGGSFPALMRLGEALGQHRYRAVFVDLAGEPQGYSERNSAYSRAVYTLRKLPVELIDVSDDPAGVLQERLQELCGEHSKMASLELQDGSHDLVCFFPGLAAAVARAMFYRYDDETGPVAEAVRRRIHIIGDDNPYRTGAVPSIPDTILHVYRERYLEDRTRAADARRAAGETQYCIEPEGKPQLREEGLWGGEVRSEESMAVAEARLAAFGFEKVVEGQVVSYRRKMPDGLLFADPRREGRIEITKFRLEAPTRKKGRSRWLREGRSQTVQDTWWVSDPAGKAAAFLVKYFGATNEQDRSK